MKKASSAAELQAAIRQLEAYSRQAARHALFSPLAKTISFVRSFWRQALAGKEVAGKASGGGAVEKNALLRAVEVINRERLYIQTMQGGSTAEQKLANALTSAIDSYNKHAYAPSPPNKGLAQYLSGKLITAQELPLIHLPQQTTVTYHYPPQMAAEVAASTAKYAMHVIQPMALAPEALPLSKQSKELFQMKVLALLERYGIATNPEARALVKQSPIHTSVKGVDGATCMLTQTLTLFPGQTVVVMGTSALDPKTQTISRLFPESFYVSLKSTQTAFPHASQRAGWTLANQLLPECPQRMDLLKQAAELFQQKQQTMQALLPQGVLIGKAKQLLKLKKKVFSAHQGEFIAMHQQLAKALMQAAPAAWVLPQTAAVVESFYAAFNSHSFAFERLIETNQSISEIFIAQPQRMLFDAIIKGKHTEFGSPQAGVRYAAAKSILAHACEGNVMKLAHHQPAHDQIRSEYIACIGHVLGLAAQPIILQYLSEDLIFTPPVLTIFEQRVQAAAYLQVSDFLQELNLPLESEENVYQRFRHQMEADIACFQTAGKLSLPAELAAYYQQRYIHLSAI